MIQAIIFDFDGTILDTESPWYDLVRELYDGYGFELPLADYHQCIGASGEEFDVYQHLEFLLGTPIDRQGIRDALTERHRIMMESASLRPGVLDLLSQCRQHGLALAIASSSPRSWVEKYLGQFSLLDYFPAVLTADDVRRVKPDPELFATALSRLGAPASQTLVVEDSSNGLRAATAAGIDCVVVPNRLTRSMEFSGARRLFNEFTEISIKELLVLDDRIAYP